MKRHIIYYDLNVMVKELFYISTKCCFFRLIWTFHKVQIV